ncbi:hypothetical protein Nepgr_028352 [Nepenthes gracilis]|uniref:Uncharacterized protein n=1 Tax=Nepenthes gracilis TaxID=150966 RepID=A0AAD3TCP4_NEPGR|nr:hypothetical protein Nepgr_028352 [Nepenthes gracilis]
MRPFLPGSDIVQTRCLLFFADPNLAVQSPLDAILVGVDECRCGWCDRSFADFSFASLCWSTISLSMLCCVGSCDAGQWLAPLVVFDCYAAGIGMNAAVGLMKVMSMMKYCGLGLGLGESELMASARPVEDCYGFAAGAVTQFGRGLWEPCFWLIAFFQLVMHVLLILSGSLFCSSKESLCCCWILMLKRK